MNHGYLSQYFNGVASKKLSVVETDANTSNQHELNGVGGLIKILGKDRGTTIHFKTRFIYFNDSLDEPIQAEGQMGWYDSRRNHPTRSEYRLYYSSNPVMDEASENDFLVVGKRPDNTLLCIITDSGSTAENQIRWLFGLNDIDSNFSIKTEEETNSIQVNFIAKSILEQLGIEIEEDSENYLEGILDQFGGLFPTTRQFSDYARHLSPDTSPKDNPDVAILEWLDKEETLFRTLERHLVKSKLDEGFSDVDSFIAFSLSVLNRRKSRAGHALENHLEAIFTTHEIQYSRGKVTENRAKPDFIFPGITEYRTEDFSTDLLTMLGAKQSCKDRWRQVLTEADRIKKKHLFTLEPGISENQTDEMKSQKLQLVIPYPLNETYTVNQQNWIMKLEELLDLLKYRQENMM